MVKEFGSKNAARTMVKNVVQYAPNNKHDEKKRCAKNCQKLVAKKPSENWQNSRSRNYSDSYSDSSC